jgi:hypothetical protein
MNSITTSNLQARNIAGNTFRGISLDNCENAVVGENYVTHANSGMSGNCDIWTIYGLYTNNSLNTWIGDNVFENLCYSIYGIDNLLFTRVECNQFIDTRGIYFQNVNIGNIGSPAQSANNEWVGNLLGNHIHGFMASMPFTSIYYWNSSQGINYNPDFSATIDPLFLADNNSSFLAACNSVPSNRGLSINELPLIANKVYPNPFKEFIVFQSASTTSFQEILVINSLGQIVYKEIINNFLSKEYKINTNHFKPGIYLAKVTTSDGSNLFKIIK